jgi:ubiquinone/menaquinone biosynthesis C-methylase UbiE
MDVWDEEAATFAEHWGGLAEPARHAIAGALELRVGVRLLDIGCGGDFCTLVLALARDAQATGIDAAPAVVAIARERAAGADTRVAAMQSLPWNDGVFDVVTGFNSLQFADDPVAVLREWVRVVRQGGKLAICAWGPREHNDLEVLEAALRGLADSPRRGGRSGARATSRPWLAWRGSSCAPGRRSPSR